MMFEKNTTKNYKTNRRELQTKEENTIKSTKTIEGHLM